MNASKVIFVTFNLNCGLHAVFVGKSFVDGKFLDSSDFLYPNPNKILVFRTPLLLTEANSK